MSDCSHSECSIDQTQRTHVCPLNGKEYKSVSMKTILHHLISPWRWTEKHQGYYFCDDPSCDVVYFGEDNSVIKKTEIRTAIGIKESKPDAMICYCFGVSHLEVRRHPSILDFIVSKTKTGMCSCDTSNPSGRCCLKDLHIKEVSNH